MQSFKRPTRLKKTAMGIMVKHLSAIQLKEIRANFKAADKDNSGAIDKEEFIEYFVNNHDEIDAAEAEKIFDNVDFDKSGTIDYEEFMIASIDLV